MVRTQTEDLEALRDMSSIYLVRHQLYTPDNPYDGSDAETTQQVHGVFSSLEKAEEFIEKKAPNSFFNRKTLCGPIIQEWTVDGTREECIREILWKPRYADVSTDT